MPDRCPTIFSTGKQCRYLEGHRSRCLAFPEGPPLTVVHYRTELDMPGHPDYIAEIGCSGVPRDKARRLSRDGIVVAFYPRAIRNGRYPDVFVGGYSADAPVARVDQQVLLDALDVSLSMSSVAEPAQVNDGE